MRLNNPEPSNPDGKVAARASEGVVEFVARVSTEGQEGNLGSILAQLGKGRRWLEKQGISFPNFRDTTFVETAKGGFPRQHFDELLDRIGSKETRVLVVGYGNRIARNHADGARLLDVAAEAQAMIVVGERPYDPRDPDDRATLMRQFVDAERENQQRALHSADARDALAKNLKLRRILPTGLCWVAETDPNYEGMAEQNGVGANLLSKERLANHQTTVQKSDVNWYVMFDPHKDVYSALTLLCRWILETGSVQEAIARMAHAPYPRPGLFPVTTRNVFNPALPPTWKPVTRGAVHAWLKSEALYGIYTYCSFGLNRFGQEGSEVWVPNAFPAFFDESQLPLVSDIARRIPHHWNRGFYLGPRNHSLPLVRCARQLESGQVCGRPMGTFYEPRGHHEYFCGRCYDAKTGSCRVHRHIDAFVLSVLADVFTSDRLSDLASLTVTDLQRIREKIVGAEKRLKALDTHIDSGMNIQVEARSDKNDALERLWKVKVAQLTAEQDATRRELLALEQERERVSELTSEAQERLACLAGDVSQMLTQARALESSERASGLVREIVGVLTRCVHVRPLMPTLYEVDIEFPSGIRVRGYVSTTRTLPTAQERMVIASELKRGTHPAEIAASLSRYRAAFRSRRKGRVPRGPWTVEAVVGVDLTYPVPGTRPRVGSRPVGIIAAQNLADEDEVAGAILANELGPAVLIDNELCASPTLKQIESALPDSGIMRAARAAGWPLDDVCRLAEVVVEFGCCRTVAERKAAQLGVLIRTPARKVIVRRSVLCAALASLGDGAVEAPPEYAHVPTEAWRTREQLLREYPAPVHRSVCRLSAKGKFSNGRCAHYVSPELRAELLWGPLQRKLEEIGLGHIPYDEFMHQAETKRLCKAIGGAGFAQLRTAIRRGFVLTVKAETPGTCSVYCWIPGIVRTTSDPEIVTRWLAGEYPPPKHE